MEENSQGDLGRELESHIKSCTNKDWKKERDIDKQIEKEWMNKRTLKSER